MCTFPKCGCVSSRWARNTLNKPYVLCKCLHTASGVLEEFQVCVHSRHWGNLHASLLCDGISAGILSWISAWVCCFVSFSFLCLMLCKLSCSVCSLLNPLYCIYVLHVCNSVSSFSGFWTFHLKYNWFCCELIFLVCSSVSDFYCPNFGPRVFHSIPRQPCVPPWKGMLRVGWVMYSINLSRVEVCIHLCARQLILM